MCRSTGVRRSGTGCGRRGGAGRLQVGARVAHAHHHRLAQAGAHRLAGEDAVVGEHRRFHARHELVLDVADRQRVVLLGEGPAGVGIVQAVGRVVLVVECRVVVLGRGSVVDSGGTDAGFRRPGKGTVGTARPERDRGHTAGAGQRLGERNVTEGSQRRGRTGIGVGGGRQLQVGSGSGGERTGDSALAEESATIEGGCFNGLLSHG
jgi:hypothetical protein